MMKTLDLLRTYPDLPNVDGEGFLFAFSGMDGETCSASQFVLTRHREGYDFLVETPQRHRLRIRLGRTGTVHVATGDVFVVEFDDAMLIVSFSAWHTLVGQLPNDAVVSLLDESRRRVQDVSKCSKQDETLALARMDSRFSLSYGNSRVEAESRALTGLTALVDEVIQQRLAPYRSLPRLADHRDSRLLRKCFSVMRVNTLAAEGVFRQAWSTPDRVPHKDLWLWDSVFHSLAMNKVNAGFGWHFLKSVLDQQALDGMISHQVRMNGWKSDITQPPILAWGVWENYLAQQNRDVLAYAAPRLAAYLDWDARHRDRNGNSLLEWQIEGDRNCRSGESGMDNSQRFDEALLLDAVDFSAFAALEMAYLARMYDVLGDTGSAQAWRSRSSLLSGAVHQQLWNSKLGFYCDRKMDGTFSPVQAVTGFLPLLLDDFPAERLPVLVTALQDESRFNTRFPLSSVAVSTPGWSTDMWRGATWINMNYLCILGFEKQGMPGIANEIRRITIDRIRHYYEQTGVIYEFFDAKDQIFPAECDRKGRRKQPYDIRRKMDSIRDYHWSAALCYLMLADTETP